MLNNLELVNFCQEMLGAPYWFDAPAIKATKNAYKVNSMRYPYEYEQKEREYFEQHIQDNEVVTDAVGLIKGFMWSNGGHEILEARGNEKSYFIKKNTNGCPDKTINGMFTYAVEQGANWGPIDTLPEIPGIVITVNGRLGIYEGKGYVIEARGYDEGCIRTKIENDLWKFWYQLPFIEYLSDVSPAMSEKESSETPLALQGIGYALTNVLFREEPTEDAKFLEIIEKDSEVSIYNDSTSKWLHLLVGEQEGYALANYFLCYPEKPDVLSPVKPNEVNKEITGEYIIINNASLRDQSTVRGRIYINIPKDTVVFCTGGISSGWYQTYVEFKGRKYVGYLNPKMLKKVENNEE